MKQLCLYGEPQKEEEMWVYRSGARPMNNVIGGEGKS